ncbi:MAG: T9SS type A sorting domain-containing protein [Owenweeksia sp.]|nr:T9SS type A sorting domain-containing protein [Owenweeksia sp.]
MCRGRHGVVPGLSCAPCSGNEVRVLVLIDASTKADVRAMANGDTIYRSLLPLFSVRADVCVSSATESVVFDLNGSSIRTESVEPYIVNGDVAGNYTPWDPGNGNHTLTAIPFDNNGGNGSMGIAKAVNFWVVDGPPPADCAGIVGGSAFFDACGDCAGGSTGTVPNSSCTDCNGEVNGTALVDTCGICTGGSTGVIPNASCTDCNGDLFGLAVIDACGDCAGGNTTLVPNAACTDCNGDINGTAVVDSCGDCVLGATGAAFNSGCNIDCNGVVDGTALLDSCGVCAGGNTGVTPNTVCLDCHGDLNGTAFFDACGDCAGGNTALVPNAACTDCHGDVNGTAFTDTCGVCAGGNTGTVPDQSCATCVQLEVVSLTLMQAGSGGPIRQLLNGDVIYKSTTGPFSVRADVCDQPVGSVVFNVNGNNIQTESVFPYAINGDGGGSFNQWDPAPGNYIITAMPYSNNGGNGTAGIAETVTITVMNDPPPTDCHGDTNGTASVDACGVCAGGATGKTPNATCTDCNGEPNGTASFDACGICTGGSTGVIPNASCTDCNGDLFGLAAIDACGDCAGGNTTLVPNAACTDCNGDINGTAVVDSCGDCVLGATGAAFNSGCNIDCNGVVDGTALLDSCGVCAGGNTGVTPNTVCLDCHGDLNGTAFFDACGDCAGGNTALVPNAACTDCHGDVNGTAFTDTCGVCAGGNTGTVPNSCGGCTDNEVVSLILINANTGVDIGAITIGDTIDKSQLPEFSMRAEVCTPSAVGSVEFELNGNNIRTENVAPYSINGDNSGNYDPWDPGIGSHTVSAIPYSGNNGSGIMGRSKTVNFWVIDGPPPTDCNGVIYGSAYYDACGDCVGGSTGLTPCATSAGCDEFIEGGGLVVVEVESEPKANNNWYEGTGTINGLTVDPPSGSYYMWKVNCVSGTDPNYDYSSCGGTDGGNSGNAMTYEIYISYPGRYRFQMRSWQPGIKLSNHGASTENNDFWLQLPDGGGIKKKSSTEISIGSSEWVKVYQNSTWNWVWKTSTVDNSPHDIFVDFPTAGTYTVKIGARSKLMGLDRFVLYRSENASGNVSEAMATTAMPPESPRGSCASVTYNRDHNNQGQTQQQQSNRATGVALIENSPVPQQFNLRVYPNPTTGALQVEFEPAEARAELMLYDATGKLLQRFPAVQGVLHLDLSHYAEGLYWLKMCSDGEVITKRIMKN